MTIANADLDIKDSSSTKRGWPTKATLWASVVVSFIVWLFSTGAWNEPSSKGDIFSYDDSADFAANVELMGSSFRTANYAQFATVIGYVVFVAAVGLLVRRLPRLHRLRQLSLATTGLVLLAGFVDIVGTIGRLLSLGLVDLDNLGPTEVVSPPDSLVHFSDILLQTRGILWTFCVLSTFVTIVAAVVIKLARWLADR